MPSNSMSFDALQIKKAKAQAKEKSGSTPFDYEVQQRIKYTKLKNEVGRRTEQGTLDRKVWEVVQRNKVKTKVESAGSDNIKKSIDWAAKQIVRLRSDQHPNRYQIWLLRDQGKIRMPIPLLPESYQVTRGNRVSSVDIVGLGEVILKEDLQATRIGWTSSILLPGDPAAESYLSEAYKSLSPGGYLTLFTMFTTHSKPILLSMVGMGISMYCRCESFSYTESGGAPGELQYTISFAQHKETGIQIAQIDQATNKIELPSEMSEKRPDTRVAPSTYTTAAGDTIFSVATKFYNDSSMADAIKNLNSEKVQATGLLAPGTNLKLPL